MLTTQELIKCKQNAIKEGNTVEKNVISEILSEIDLARTAKRTSKSKPVDYDYAQDVALQVVKRLKNNIEEYLGYGKMAVVAQLRAELAIAEKYIPTQLTEVEITQAVEAFVAQLHTEGVALSMKTVMGPLRDQMGDNVEGKLLSTVVQKVLAANATAQ